MRGAGFEEGQQIEVLSDLEQLALTDLMFCTPRGVSGKPRGLGCVDCGSARGKIEAAPVTRGTDPALIEEVAQRAIRTRHLVDNPLLQEALGVALCEELCGDRVYVISPESSMLRGRRSMPLANGCAARSAWHGGVVTREAPHPETRVPITGGLRLSAASA